MSACIITNGQDLDCVNSVGGIATIYIATFSGSTSYTYDANDQVTGLTGANSFYEFQVPRNVASYSDVASVVPVNQNTAYKPMVSFAINKLAATTRNKILLLAKARTVAIAKTINGDYILLGAGHGLTVETLDIGSGVQSADRSGYTIALSGLEDVPAYHITYAAFSAKIVANV